MSQITLPLVNFYYNHFKKIFTRTLLYTYIENDIKVVDFQVENKIFSRNNKNMSLQKSDWWYSVLHFLIVWKSRDNISNFKTGKKMCADECEIWQ